MSLKTGTMVPPVLGGAMVLSWKVLMTMGKKRWKQTWKPGMSHATPWGSYVDITGPDGTRVAQVAVKGDDTTDLNMVLMSPRMAQAIKSVVKGLASYGHTISDLFDHDEATMNAIWELRKCAQLLKSRKTV